MTSREALLTRLGCEKPLHRGALLGPGRGLREFEEIGAHLLLNESETYDAADGFLLVGSDGWTAGRQRLLAGSLRDRPRPVLVGNPDLSDFREGGLTLEPAISPIRWAMPVSAEVGAAASRSKRSSASRCRASTRRAPLVLMVGDTLHTDIVGAGLGLSFGVGHRPWPAGGA